MRGRGSGRGLNLPLTVFVFSSLGLLARRMRVGVFRDSSGGSEDVEIRQEVEIRRRIHPRRFRSVGSGNWVVGFRQIYLRVENKTFFYTSGMGWDSNLGLLVARQAVIKEVPLVLTNIPLTEYETKD